jgi:lipoprotein-anchoring transpeptidase ErfK/SrfK
MTAGRWFLRNQGRKMRLSTLPLHTANRLLILTFLAFGFVFPASAETTSAPTAAQDSATPPAPKQKPAKSKPAEDTGWVKPVPSKPTDAKAPENKAAQANPSSSAPPGKPTGVKDAGTGASPSAAKAEPDASADGVKPDSSAEAKPGTSAGEAKPAGQAQSGSGAAKPGASDEAPAAAKSEAPAKPPGKPILITIDKTTQEMTVLVDGIEEHRWPVSTGAYGYTTPSGSYTATSMNEIWYSKQWDNAPMPNAIFFTKKGHAIHGSLEVKRLGTPASHGCVRLSPKNAKTLYALVKANGLENTQVVIDGETPGGEAVAAVQPRYGERDPWFGQGYYPPPGYYPPRGYYPPPRRRGMFGGWFGPYGPRGYYRPPRGYYPPY